MQRELLRKRQAVRIASTRQEDFGWQTTATWERLLEQKKERLSRSLGIAQAWVHVRIGLHVFSVLLALRRLDSKE